MSDCDPGSNSQSGNIIDLPQNEDMAVDQDLAQNFQFDVEVDSTIKATF